MQHPHLDLFKQRKYSTVTLGDGAEYKLPNEYTVEEVERILELQEEIEALENQQVEGDGKAQRERHNALIFAQLEIMFQHHQPDMDASQLQKVITHNEALEIIGFFRKYRHLALKEMREETAEQAGSKKKAKLGASKELRELRRMITYMVICGFSLLELRKLYIDELHQFYYELIFHKEATGELKKGSYDKIKSRSKDTSGVADTVATLRKQMFQSIADLNKKQRHGR